jgi:hypothetical protein
MPNGNGEVLTKNILSRLQSIDDKMDKVLQRTAVHGAALRWLYGIVAVIVVTLVLNAAGAR